MFRISISAYTGLLLTAVCILALSSFYWRIFEKKQYQIEPGSKLYLKGTSNVNKFTCDCGDSFYPQTLEMENKGPHTWFQNADLSLRTKNFNCHNRKIDRDMQAALQADKHPKINIVLLESQCDPKILENIPTDWFAVQAKVRITIAGNTKTETIMAKAMRTDENHFALSGEKALQMSAFGIDPPEAMFGLIKVNDWITFHFDLLVRIDGN